MVWESISLLYQDAERMKKKNYWRDKKEEEEVGNHG